MNTKNPLFSVLLLSFQPLFDISRQPNTATNVAGHFPCQLINSVIVLQKCVLSFIGFSEDLASLIICISEYARMVNLKYSGGNTNCTDNGSTDYSIWEQEGRGPDQRKVATVT